MATFLLEVGTEELPASFVADGIKQWEQRIPQSLSQAYLTPESLEVYGTPRRLAVLVRGLPQQQPDQAEEVKGPPAQAAFKDGQPTPAATGFAQKQGVSVADLEIRATDKGAFVFAQKVTPGRPTPAVLAELVLTWITGLEGKRFMRWSDGDLRFPRPIRWLVALLDETVLPITLQNGSGVIQSGRVSEGHRVLHPTPITLTQAADYVTALAAAGVEVRAQQRRVTIREQVEQAGQQVGGWAEIYPDLLEEVVNLVESPSIVVGKFDPDFLELPPEVIITEMVSHQRYFPVRKEPQSTELLPYFITISNGDPAKAPIIAAGNERVIRARLSDGKFFYNADRAKPLEDYLPQLELVTFQEALGSMRLKVERLTKIATQIATQLQLREAERTTVQRAALLCKADLVTQMVGEFPELQGAMGEKYALTSGETPAVATAIFEHYLPRNAGDRLPQSLAGQVVGLADRLDTLVSIFSLGMIPTGSSDPFALRRAANSIVNITWTAELPWNLHGLLEQVCQDFAATRASVQVEELLASLKEFFLQRIRSLLQEDRGIDYDLVNAVLGENDPEYTERALNDLLDVRDRALFLQSIRDNGSLSKVYETVNRSARLATQGNLGTAALDPHSLIRPELFKQPSEAAFYEGLIQLMPQTQAAQAERDYQKLLQGLEEIAPTVSQFFDGPQSVLVMDPDPEIKNNRLNLLGLLRNHARVLADFGAIVKS